ncbi:MAG: SRPBCC family protein [Bacteroidota bacterium]
MPEYNFITYLKINASREEVWELIKDLRKWPEWWRGVLDVREISKGSNDDHGTRFAHIWRSLLPYKLKFVTEITGLVPYKSIEASVTGELEGIGRWEFSYNGDSCTSLIYYWRVKTNARWMNLTAPVLSRIFRWNHDTVMRWGALGIARNLKCRVEFRSEWIR